MDHPRPWLRYVDADDLDDSTIDFDGLNVESPTGDKLGDVDGFIIDSSSARPYYVVVDGGGWFKSKFFLLPVGHVNLDAANRKLVADLGKDRVQRYPGFDRGEFEKLSDDELNRMDSQMMAACCPSELDTRSASTSRFDTRAHYRAPGWWDADFYRPDRADTAARSIAGVSAVGAARDRGRARDPEAVVAREGDVSPHLDGRAQPGDVLGVETGGEQTHIGETSDDENKRRIDAERAASKPRRG
jgi:PRC-barrel domain protein